MLGRASPPNRSPRSRPNRSPSSRPNLTHRPAIDGPVILYALLAYMQRQPWCFTSGALVIDDPGHRLHRLLTLSPRAYTRASTHRNKVRKARNAAGQPIYPNLGAREPQYAIDLAPTRLACAHDDATTIRTALFFRLPNRTRPRLYLKFEAHACRGPLCVRSGRNGLAHAAEFIATRFPRPSRHTRKEHGARPTPNELDDPRLVNVARDSPGYERMGREVHLRQRDLAEALLAPR